MSDGGLLPNCELAPIQIQRLMAENAELRASRDQLRARCADLMDRVIELESRGAPRICNKAQAFNLTELVAAINGGIRGWGFSVEKGTPGHRGQRLEIMDREKGSRWLVLVQPMRNLSLVSSHGSDFVPGMAS